MIIKLKHPKKNTLQLMLEHKCISLWDNDINITASHKAAFDNLMGCYSEFNDAWTFPSPIDAIKIFNKFPTLIENGTINI